MSLDFINKDISSSQYACFLPVSEKQKRGQTAHVQVNEELPIGSDLQFIKVDPAGQLTCKCLYLRHQSTAKTSPATPDHNDYRYAAVQYIGLKSPRIRFLHNQPSKASLYLTFMGFFSIIML
jgi:hypothetical protein